MAEKVTFDGENKLITINAGETQIDVGRDLYSAWKRWVINDIGSRYDEAFRTFGGDVTSYDATTDTTQYAPRYYFLTNDWRVVVDNDLVVNFESNLYTDRDDNQIFIVTAPSSVRLKNNDLTILAAGSSQLNEYGGWVYLDTSTSNTGTTYPVGTPSTPVNNLPDAVSIASQYNIHQIEVRGIVNVTQDLDGFLIRGGAGYTLLIMNGYNNEQTEFERMYIAGDIGPGKPALFDIIGFADGVTNINGLFRQCAFAGTAYVQDEPDILMLDCSTKRTDDYHGTFDFVNVTTPGTFFNYGYNGRTAVKNHTVGVSVFGFKSGDIELYDTCTGGSITISGIPSGALVDNSDGSTISATLSADQASLDSLQAAIEAEQQQNAYGGRIHIDVNSANSGTTYPVGTGAVPVNNVADAYAISLARGIEEFHLDSDVTWTQSLTGYRFTGANIENTLTFDGTAVLMNVRFENLRLAGDLDATNQGLYGTELYIADGITNFNGFYEDCAFEGEVFIANNADLHFRDCISKIPGTGSPTLNFINVTVGASVGIRRFAGGLRYENMTRPDIIMTASYVTGKAHIEDSNTAGYISVRGLPDTAVNDNRSEGNTGLTVDLTGTSAGGPTVFSLLERIEYGDRVVIDIVNGISGTSYPVGTHGTPVDNLADALVIANNVNTRKLHLHSNLTIDQNIPDILIEGVSGKEVLTFTNVNVDNCYFTNLYLIGAISGGQFRAKDCALGPVAGLSGISGAFDHCGVVGDITMAVSSLPTVFTNCFVKKLSLLDDDPTINFGDGINTTTPLNVGFSNQTGTIRVANLKAAGSEITFDMASGFLYIEASNTAGNIRITGLVENGYTNLSALDLDVSNIGPSAPVLNAKIERDNYNHKVVIDPNSGYVGVDYPNGTYQYPVNNLIDAKAIADNYGFYEFEILGDLTMNLAMSGYRFRGKSGGERLTFDGTQYTQSTFNNFYVTGDLGGTLLRLEHCRMNGVTNFVGSMWDCIIFDDIKIKSGEEFLLRNCFTAQFTAENPDALLGAPTIIMGDLLDGQSMVGNIRGWHGPLKVSNMDNADKSLTIHADAGFLVIDDTNTDGFMFVQGFNPNGISDNSSGNFFWNFLELAHTIGPDSQQVVRDALTKAPTETPEIGSVDNIIDRVDKNTQTE